MRLNTEKRGRTLLVYVAGELDLKTAGVFREEIDGELDRHKDILNLVLVLDGVTFIDSSGLGAILGRYKRIAQAGGRMAAARVSPQVKKIFELSGILKIIQTFNTEEEALCLA